MIGSRIILHQPLNDDVRTNENRKVATGQGDDYTTGCLLCYYYYFKENYQTIAIDLSKQQALDADP